MKCSRALRVTLFFIVTFHVYANGVEEARHANIRCVGQDNGHDMASTDISLLQTDVHFQSAKSVQPLLKSWGRSSAKMGPSSLQNGSGLVKPLGVDKTQFSSEDVVRTGASAWSHERLFGELDLGDASTLVWSIFGVLVFTGLVAIVCGRTKTSPHEVDESAIADVQKLEGPAAELSDEANTGRARVGSEERIAAEQLPDLHDRIQRMGLTQEYAAYRERYFAWRTGSARGAECQLDHVDIARRYRGFGYWYPDSKTWAWRRSMSFWIAVTFFEGSLFFALSSFFFNYSEKYYGRYAEAVTTLGYAAGKVNYFICTYLMCVETLNLTSEGDDEGSNGKRCIDSDVGFVWWPFNFRQAVSRLERLGVGPYPYYASVTYFMAVIVFAIGLVFDFVRIDYDVASLVKAVCFTIGSIMFVLGGVAECLENNVFTAEPKLGDVVGWWGALLNLIGGIWFLIGSINMFFSSQAYMANVSFGIGAILYAIGSGAMLIMWKDEQFGLTFLAVLNKLGGEHGRPLTKTDDDDVAREMKTFSWVGAFFIIIYIVGATLSTYDCFIAFADLFAEQATWFTALVMPFNAILPCIFAHGFLAVNCAVVQVPQEAPFRELYVGCRIIAILMAFVSAVDLIWSLRNADDTTHVKRTTVSTYLLSLLK